MAGTVLVTGANGFVGSALTRGYLEAGWRVRCLVRRTSRLDGLPRERVELVYGDVAEGTGLAAAVQGADLVVHNAGITHAPSEERYMEVNAHGAAKVAAAAAAASRAPARLVLVSSLAAGGPSRPGAPRREEDPEAPAGPYGRSKLAGERLFQRNAGEIPVTVIRPPAVYGPRDRGFLRLARMVARGISFRLSGPPQPVSVIHVDDLVDGLREAASHPDAAGRTYYLANFEPVTWPQVGEWMGEALDKRPKVAVFPRALVPVVGSVLDAASRLAGKTSPLPEDRIRDLLAAAWTCDPGRAEKETGFRPRISPADGMIETVRWYQREGWL